MFSFDLNTIVAAITMTCIAVSVVLVIAMVVLGLARHEDPQCRARRAGWRCTHPKGHPGSHRDEQDQYWD